MEQNPQPPQQTPAPDQQEDILNDAFDDSMQGYDKPIRNARIVLYVVAVLQLVGVFTAFSLPEPESYITMGVYIFFGGVFAVLAAWTQKKPFTALVTALSIYTALQVIGFIFDPASLFSGIILKIVVFVLLITALRNAKDVQQWLDAKRERERR